MTDAVKMKTLIDAVRNVVGLDCLGIEVERGEATLTIMRAKIAEVLGKLRDHPDTAMNCLMDITAVDYPARAERFDVIYQLLSLKHNWRLCVRTQTTEVHALPSAQPAYSSAGWYEREVFDMFGISFDGHTDLRRILTDYDFIGYPLRRDFPLVGFTEKRYDDLQRRVVEQPVSLEQDYRAFDALSPWQGLTDVQKRTEGGQ